MSSPHWPEPDFFTLQQISQRWAQWDCDESKLIQLCRSKKIEIGINLSPTPVKDESYSHVFNNTNLIEGFVALSIDDIERVNDGIQTVIKKVYESKKPTSSKQPGTSYQLVMVEQISSYSLVITKTERDRFEKEHDLIVNHKVNTQKNVNKPLHSIEKTNMLRGIKLLIKILKIDINHPSSAADKIIKEAARAEIGIPSRNTIVNWLKELPDD